MHCVMLLLYQIMPLYQKYSYLLGDVGELALSCGSQVVLVCLDMRWGRVVLELRLRFNCGLKASIVGGRVCGENHLPRGARVHPDSRGGADGMSRGGTPG